MKHLLHSTGLTSLFLIVFSCCYAQDLDLIVTAKGDSIACRIDSINDTHIYYEMKFRNAWIHTHIDLKRVSQYDKEAVEKGQYLYKPGTTIIDSSIPAIPASLHHVRKNSVYIGILSINYARMFPLSQTTGLTLGGGLYNFDGWGVVVESSVFLGGVRHFFEPGIMGFYSFEQSEEPAFPERGDVIPVTFRIGYRYQAPSGFLFRVASHFIFLTKGFFIIPALSIGYSF
jgi:hypothetical protein